MYIYPENTEQWRIDLIENPPPSASMFEHIEWRDIVLNELFKHGNEPGPTKGWKMPDEMKIAMKKAHDNPQTRERHAEANRIRWSDPSYKQRVSVAIKDKLNHVKHRIARSITRSKTNCIQNKNRKWITNGTNNRFIKFNTDFIMPEGWKFGKTFKGWKFKPLE
jgi:hypothetical protein